MNGRPWRVLFVYVLKADILSGVPKFKRSRCLYAWNRPQKEANKESALEKVKVVEYEKDGEQHVENHADENDKVEKLRIPSLLAWFVLYWFIHGVSSPFEIKKLIKIGPRKSSVFCFLDFVLRLAR